MKAFSFTISSIVNKDQINLWEDIWDLEGVNYELSPIVKMTYPKDLVLAVKVEEVPLGEYLFKSTILLFGFIPIDLHHLKLKSINPPVSFGHETKRKR